MASAGTDLANRWGQLLEGCGRAGLSKAMGQSLARRLAIIAPTTLGVSVLSSTADGMTVCGPTQGPEVQRSSEQRRTLLQGRPACPGQTTPWRHIQHLRTTVRWAGHLCAVEARDVVTRHRVSARLCASRRHPRAIRPAHTARGTTPLNFVQASAVLRSCGNQRITLWPHNSLITGASPCRRSAIPAPSVIMIASGSLRRGSWSTTWQAPGLRLRPPIMVFHSQLGVLRVHEQASHPTRAMCNML